MSLSSHLVQHEKKGHTSVNIIYDKNNNKSGSFGDIVGGFKVGLNSVAVNTIVIHNNSTILSSHHYHDITMFKLNYVFHTTVCPLFKVSTTCWLSSSIFPRALQQYTLTCFNAWSFAVSYGSVNFGLLTSFLFTVSIGVICSE